MLLQRHDEAARPSGTWRAGGELLTRAVDEVTQESFAPRHPRYRGGTVSI